MLEKIRTRRRTAVLAALVLTVPMLFTPAAARAARTTGTNMVITWAVHSQTAAYEVARQPPYINGRTFAMVQGAVYDAANAVSGTPYRPYLISPPARRGDSLDAAVA